jgi:hypothetical protein
LAGIRALLPAPKAPRSLTCCLTSNRSISSKARPELGVTFSTPTLLPYSEFPEEA